MKRCTRCRKQLFLTVVFLLVASCASSPRGHIVPLKEESFAEGSKAKTEAKAPVDNVVHTQARNGELPAIPADNEDAAVFYYSLGQAYALDNDTDKAIEAYRATLVYDPNSALVHARLAAELVKQGSFSEARELCEKAIRLDPKFIDSYLLLAGVHVATKEYKQALSVYRQALQADPNNRDGLLYYGVTLAEVGKYSEAIAALAKLVKTKENVDSQIDQSVAYFYLAKVQQQAGQSKAAIATLKDALEKRPGFVKAAMLLAEIYGSQHEDKLARKTLEDVFRESPDTEVAGHLAQEFLADGKYDKAVLYLETLVEEDPTNENLHLKLGLVYWQLHWLDKAHNVFSNILSRHPASDDVLYYMAELELERSGSKAALPYYKRISSDYSKFEMAIGRAVGLYRELKNYPAAQGLLVDSLKKRPDLVSFYPLLAALYEDTDQLADAREVLELGRQRFPADENILYYLGFLYDRLGDKNKGFATMEALLIVNPKNANALNFLGYTLLERGEDLAKAGEYLSQAVTIKPNDAFIVDSFGWLLYKQGKMAQSMKYLERAHALKPEEAVILEHLADVYLAMNMRQKALDAFKQTYAMGGDSKVHERVGTKITNLETALAQSDTRVMRREPAMARPVPIDMPKRDERVPASTVPQKE